MHEYINYNGCNDVKNNSAFSIKNLTIRTIEVKIFYRCRLSV